MTEMRNEMRQIRALAERKSNASDSTATPPLAQNGTAINVAAIADAAADAAARHQAHVIDISDNDEEMLNAHDTVLIPGLTLDASKTVRALQADPKHPASAMTTSSIAKLRLKGRTSGGPDPGFKLDTKDTGKYQHWLHAITKRFQRDWYVYLTDADKVSYAMTWLDGNLFTHIDDWWTDPNSKNKTYNGFLFEVETLLGIRFQADEAKRQLDLIFQKQ
ncbi:hypothetical protein KEM56_002954, partial [Ascosphaera pollenicola]